MMFRATTQLALAALLRNKMRSLLTMLGIVIGVAAVIMMQMMGRGATAYIGEAISGLGNNMLFVLPGITKGMNTATQGVPLFTAPDIDAIRRQARDVALVAPAGQRPMRAVRGSNNRTTNVAGVTPDYFQIRELGASSGRMLNADDERRGALVCLVGQTIVDTLWGGGSPLGQDLRLHDISCRVVGVVEAKGSTFGSDRDDVVFLPFSTFSRRIVGNDRINFIIASAVAADRIDDATDEIVRVLRRRRHILPGDDDDFTVRDPREIESLLTSVTGVLTTLLAGVAAVSLVVGGIGIMNIMLVSVTERTREIGVRLAIGARADDILTQFLVEATTLSTIGGIMGIALGLAGGYAVSRGLHLPYVIPGVAAPIAFGVSVVVGVAFGVFPARKASRLNPLAALRFE
jgi:putative ABC transport system permease protein